MCIRDRGGHVGDAANKSQIAPLVTGTGGVADVAALRVDLGDGERSYAMGVHSWDHELRIWAYDNQPQAWTINLFENGSPAQLTNGGFGAAWSHEDRFYFASNSGAGVYEIDIPSIDLNAKPRPSAGSPTQTPQLSTTAPPA